MASEELGFCEADDSCRCDCPFGHCYDAEAGTPDASDGDDGGAGGCTAAGGECGDGEVCDLHSCDPAAVGSCVPRPEPQSSVRGDH
jgi:hypothetical protein